VTGERREAEERILDVAIRATNDLGDHATGTVVLSLRPPVAAWPDRP